MSQPIHDLRALEIAQGDLWEEKRVEHMWFHVVRGMIMKGEIGRMGAVPWAVYCALKAHTNLESGDAAPGIARIAELIGSSHDTVQRALKTLIDLEYVQVRKRGRQNVYALTEKMDIVTQAGDPYVTASRKYAPMSFGHFVEELQRFARTGNLPGDRAITFNVNVTVNNIQQGDNGQVTIGDIQNVTVSGSGNQVVSADLLPAELRQRLKRIE
jgi:DNA-binding transcriptional ArsR family regulator